MPSFKQPTVHRRSPDDAVPSTRLTPLTRHAFENNEDGGASEGGESSTVSTKGEDRPTQDIDSCGLIEDFVGRDSKERTKGMFSTTVPDSDGKALSKDKQKLIRRLAKRTDEEDGLDNSKMPDEVADSKTVVGASSIAVRDFNERLAEQESALLAKESAPNMGSVRESEGSGQRTTGSNPPPSSSIIQNAFDRMRPRRDMPDVATVTIGSKTMTTALSSSSATDYVKNKSTSTSVGERGDTDDSRANFSSSLRSFAAPQSELPKTVGRSQSKAFPAVTRRTESDDDGLSDIVSQSSSDQPSAASSAAIDHFNHSDSVKKTQSRRSSSKTGDQSSRISDADSDEDYIDEDEKKAIEEDRVSELIRKAEAAPSFSTQDNRKRAHQILKGDGDRDTTTHLIQSIDSSISKIQAELDSMSRAIARSISDSQVSSSNADVTDVETSPEERLSLTVSKSDFAAMRVCGQFNLGFVLATRNNADLFIIDQHASDEKYNFERLQATTVVQNQRLVRPRNLDLTAVEEEIILEHNDALLKNGFLIETDTNEESPVGQRCRLVSLPMSREVVFDVTDLEELLALLAESPASSNTMTVPRPSKVRRMFAMRACRSSIMIGRTLNFKQMEALVRKMGEIDKPWNCPHGRPTMRHICGLEKWEGWMEGDGLTGLEEDAEPVDWGSWVSQMKDRENDMESEMDSDENSQGYDADGM